MQAQVQEGCIGCGLCTERCPAVFHFEEGTAHGGPIPENQADAAREAAEGCPTAVITIQE